MTNAWECVQIDASTSDCTATATSSDPLSITRFDWLLVNMVIVSCLVILAVRTVYTIFQKR